jgi:DNA repair/transcription protein MET18/MMS19
VTKLLNFHSRNAVLDILLIISSSAPWHVREQTIPFLLSTLPDQSLFHMATVERTKCCRTLSALGVLCVQSDLYETLVVRLIAKLDLLCLPVLSASEGSSIEAKAAYAHAILATLFKTLTVKIASHHTDILKHGNSLIPALYGLLLGSALASGSHTIGTDQRLIHTAARIITLMVQVQALP